MATTTNLGLTLLEVGQKEKEVTINTNMNLLDGKVTKYLGELTTDPSITGVVQGSVYYNTGAGVFKTLSSTGAWVVSSGSGGGGGGTGTVTNVSVITANGVSGSVANSSSTPAITLSLGAITPTSVMATGGLGGDNFDFDTSAVPSNAVGRLKWNDTDGTLDIGLKGGNVVLQVGQEQNQRVTNNSGVSIPEGSIVYITGSSGNRVTVALASNSTENLSRATFGVATETIANNADGFITTEGLVRNINTLAFTQGSTVYLGAATGSLTQTHPVAPAHAVQIGWVVKSHATTGILYVKVDNGFELDELHDVLITTPADGQALVFESATGVWKNKSSVSSVGVTTAGSYASALSISTSPVTSSGNITITPNVFTSVAPGVVPLSGGGSANFLRADGTWTLPVGAPAGSTTQVQFNSGGVLTGSSNFTYNAYTLSLSNDGSAATLKGTGNLSLNSGSASTISSISIAPVAISVSGTAGTTTLKGGDTSFTGGIGGALVLQGGGSTTGSAGSVDISGGISISGAPGSIILSTNNTARAKVTGSGEFVLPSTSGSGLKVNLTTPAWGWRDLLGPITIKGVGVQDPSWATFIGGISQYQFSVGDEATFMYHIPHDFVPSSDIFFHVHWAHNATNVTGGSVTFSYEITVAKGFNQASFTTTKTGTITQSASTSQYRHMVAEGQVSTAGGTTTQIDNALIEVDGFIIVRMALSANNLTVSSGQVPEPFIFGSDIHYQSTNMATANKAPNFYA